jgi:hypothetical protein
MKKEVGLTFDLFFYHSPSTRSFAAPIFVNMTHEFSINVQQVEELQTIGNRDELESIFDKARRMVVGGGIVVLERHSPGGEVSRFEEISTEADLASYQQQVFKYLD